MKVSRRAFVGGVGAGVAALGLSEGKADAQAIYMPADWHAAEFDRLCKSPARVKQLFDCEKMENGEIFGPMKNSINGLHFGFNIPADQIKVVAALRGQANFLNFDDSMWAKYKIGEYTKTMDPKTSQPATRNPFYAKGDSRISDPKDRGSMYQDYSIEALMGRGLQLLSCHNATENQVRALIKHYSLTTDPEEIVKDLQSHMWPGVISVPAMVSAIAMLQMDGKFAYTAG